MAGETEAGTSDPKKTQEQLNVEYYGRIYESFLRKAEELGATRQWKTDDILQAADTMFHQYQDDQVSLAKEQKIHRLIEPLMERLQGLAFGGR